MKRRVLAEIIESRMREIATLVRGHLEGSGYASALGGGIVLTGKGSLLAETTTLFDEVIPLAKSRLGDVPPGKIALDAGSAVSLGIAQFVIQCQEEVSSASGDGGWRDRVRSLFPFFARR
jgi:cell division protein FtsA